MGWYFAIGILDISALWGPFIVRQKSEKMFNQLSKGECKMETYNDVFEHVGV